MVDQERPYGGPKDEELDPKGVEVGGDGARVLDQHQVDVGHGGDDEEDLDGGVVEGDEGGEEVDVAGEEDEEEEDLGLAGDAHAGPGGQEEEG